MVCVYVDDFTDEEDVSELRRMLRACAGVEWKIGFKHMHDAYTILGIYSQNRWGIMPSRYFD